MMHYFLDPQGHHHALEDAAFAHLLPAGCVPVSAAEFQASAEVQAEIAAQAAHAAQAAADAQAKAEAKADTVIQYLRDHTPAECEAYVQANVTDLASARALMKKFAVALCVLSKQSLR